MISRHQKEIQIIYLNGASSAGKSTLARALQNKFEQPFLVLGIDQIIFMMPEKFNDWHNETKVPGFNWQSIKDEQGNNVAYKIQTGPYGKHIVKALKDIVFALARTGNNVIIDDVSFGKEQVDEWCIALKDFNVFWVTVNAPIEVIEKHEKERGDRKLGSSRRQTERVHTGVTYDLTVNTHEQTVIENVAIIIKKLNEKLYI
jgi:chloramphenicol 3-O phosphotransferase